MIDYAQWLQRAEAFIRGLSNLPGQWGISVTVEPPLTRMAADDLHGLLPLGLPAPLYDLYTLGSAHFECTYRWSPDKPHLPLVGRVFPHQYSLYGGPRFILAAEIVDAQTSVRRWAAGYRSAANAPPRPGWELWHQSVPFLAVGNGDYLAIHVARDDTKLPVLYLCHDAEDGGDGHTAFEIDPSFDQFLADWETLCYVGPEIWLLAQFLTDGGRGSLEVRQPKATLWRQLMRAVSSH